MPIDRHRRGGADEPPEHDRRQAPDAPVHRQAWDQARTTERLAADRAAPEDADRQRAADKATAEQARKDAFTERLGGEPLRLRAGALLDAHMLLERRSLASDDPAVRRKTRGVYYDDTGGWGVVDSGRDDDSANVREVLESRGLAPPALAIENDVESKLAARMIRDGVTDMTVVIIRRVCVGPLSCDTLLPKMLPAGYTLRVYEHDDTERLYRGQA